MEMFLILGRKYRSTPVVACFCLLTALFSQSLQVAPAASGASRYGQIVSQSYDQQRSITETHLANGLTILSKEVHAAPVAYFSVWYRVGSRNELSGQTGLSHILEHMMFKGTNDLPPGSIDHLFLTNGGQINASTAEDRTEYHELIASDRLELAVRVEADRMEHSAFDPLQLKHEMVVVRSELEGDNNDPNRTLYDNVFRPAAFSASPYHWPTLGWLTDVESAAKHRDVIYNYYKQHYMPNNAVVVMVGDFDTKKAVGLCQKYFGVYPAGTLNEHHITPEPVQQGERRVVLRRPGTTGEILIGFHVPGVGEKDHYVLDVMSQILSSGRASRLYQSLVETGIANGADGEDADFKDPYLMTFDVSVRAGVTDQQAETAVEDQITKLQTTPVTDEEIQRAFSQIDAQFVYQNDSVTDQAEEIGGEEMRNGYKYDDTYLQNIHQVTAADIQQAAVKYLTQDNRTVAFYEPIPLPPGVSAPTAPGEKNFGAAAPITDPHQKAVIAALDKEFNSGETTTVASKIPHPVRVVLPNGMVVIVEENHANKTVAISGRVHAGSMYDPDGKWGTADLTAAMLPRGTDTMSSLQLALTLESVGASTGFAPSTEEVELSGASQSKDFKLTLSTLADEMCHPAFPQSELDKLKGEDISDLEQERQDTGGVGGAGSAAEIAFSQALFPKGHPYWQPSIDDQETAVKSISQSDLQSFYSTFYRPDSTILVIVGDVNAQDAIAQVTAAFGSWPKPDAPAAAFSIPDVPLPTAAPATQVLPVAGSPQTSILWGYPGQLRRTSSDFYAAYVMNYILGGDIFGSRLGHTIRDEDGLAYTVYSYFDAASGAGAFQVFIGANPDNATRAVSLLRSISMRLVKSGATPDELKQAKEYLTGSYPLRLETNAGVAGQLLVSEDYGLGLDYIEKRSTYFNDVTLDQVNAAVKKYLHPEDAVLILSGAQPTQ